MNEPWMQPNEDDSTWLDAIPDGEPSWWYDVVAVNEHGERVHGWDVFRGNVTGKYRRRRQADIDKIQATRTMEEQRMSLAFDLLPVYRPDATVTCPKCGSTTYKMQIMQHRDYGPDREVLERRCRGCRAIAYVKPMDWENPR